MDNSVGKKSGMRSQIRRFFLKAMLALPALPAALRISAARSSSDQPFQSVLEDSLSDGPNLGSCWEGLNPGYWRVKNGRLRRAITAVGDRARNTGFPFHYESAVAPDGEITRSYDPSLPMGIIWNRQWKLSESFGIRLSAVVKRLTARQRDDDDERWLMYGQSYGLFGISFAGQTQFESFYPSPDAAPTALMFEDGRYGIYRYLGNDPAPLSKNSVRKTSPLTVDDEISMQVAVAGEQVSLLVAVNGRELPSVSIAVADRSLKGYFGIAARGLLDIEISSVSIQPGENEALNAPLNECHVCYALGDTLRLENQRWTVKFIGICRSGGNELSIRVADSPSPIGGWQNVDVAGSARIVSNDFRRNTAVISVTLPFDPSDRAMYYTVWKDGDDVTADPRPGTDSVGPGTGLVGDVPSDGRYVGRLPRLEAPYRLCGLSCHAIHTASQADLPNADGGHCGPAIVGADHNNDCGIDRPFYVHDQPCHRAFAHFEQFNYQVLVWEDDVWYMELLLYPPSTDDAYKIVTTTIAGPTTRWQMMRHWNVLNPGDHDYGMDDVKGPEQLLIRNREDLGQDRDYMVRNFQIVGHLMTGREDPSGTDNPKRWRKWKMPNRDFSLIIVDSRLWRTSQDTAIWDDEGWGHDGELYDRRDPTRTLLGEEQFAWLSNQLRTDSSTILCLTGINVLHTIWGGHRGDQWLNELINRDRVSADYAGWVKAGADRVLDLISARDGVVSIYGDVHAGSIVKNIEKQVYECSFGPIGRWGSRSLIDGFGRRMKDFDGRDVEVISLYHHEYENVDLDRQNSLNYWNILEAEFDTAVDRAQISLTIRNITDSPRSQPRGGGAVRADVIDTGRTLRSRLPAVRTLADADLLFLTESGEPIRGARSDSRGRVHVGGLVDSNPGDRLTVLARTVGRVRSQIVTLADVAFESGTDI